MIVVGLLIFFVYLFVYALCKVSSEAEQRAGYMEEYGIDFESDEIED